MGKNAIDAAMLMTMAQPVASNDAPDTTTATLVVVLREQLHQAQLEKSRLLSLLEAEQQARRELERKLLPPPQKPTGNNRLGLLLVILLLAALVITLVRPELTGG